MELKLLDAQGQAAGNFSAPDTVFARDYNEALIHQVVVAYQANARSGNRKQKDREEVKHSTKKPWRQKGTGRARSGMTSSPLWRGGGRIFPNSPDENFSHKVNKKMYRAGMCSILSQLAREDRIAVVEEFTVDAPKTRLFAQKIKGMGLDSVLLIIDAVDDNLYLASRNLINAAVVDVSRADPVSLVHYDKVLMTSAMLSGLREIQVTAFLEAHIGFLPVATPADEAPEALFLALDVEDLDSSHFDLLFLEHRFDGVLDIGFGGVGGDAESDLAQLVRDHRAFLGNDGREQDQWQSLLAVVVHAKISFTFSTAALVINTLS